jgi:signal transduction histidine kinase
VIRPTHLALALPVFVLAAGAVLEVLAKPLPGPRALLLAAALCFSLPLLAGRRYPLQAVAVVCCAIGVDAVFAQEATRSGGAALFAGLGAVFVVALFGGHREAFAGLGIGVVTVMLVAQAETSTGGAIATFVFTTATILAVWGVGFTLRERHHRASEADERVTRAEAVARVAAAEERARIARELHDVVGHAVSVMVLQTGAVRHRLPEGRSDDREALMAVERTGRDALAEMRELVGAIRSDGDQPELAPQNGLGALASLIERTARAGLPVDLRITGEPSSLPPRIDRSAYRIVQEGLTNALKHAHAARAQVRITYNEDEIEIAVADNGRGAMRGGDAGHGLVGVRERVKIYGGEMRAGPAEGGGFVLEARLPLSRGQH